MTQLQQKNNIMWAFIFLGVALILAIWGMIDKTPDADVHYEIPRIVIAAICLIVGAILLIHETETWSEDDSYNNISVERVISSNTE